MHLRSEGANLNVTLQDVLLTIDNNIPTNMDKEDVQKFAMQAASDTAAKKLEESMREEDAQANELFTKDELVRMYPDLDCGQRAHNAHSHIFLPQSGHHWATSRATTGPLRPFRP